MNTFKKLMKDFIEDESGLTTVEYAIAGALVAGSLVVAFTQLGQAVGSTISCLTSAVGGGSTNC
ncbi:Flp family type IVb pilin [Thalassotalea ponticola]|uniref:Flp family type IVb pilin n=1 Tax=Thalassotalea ponticola TaxID=1523392 RepID=UPI0025B332FB|nr:Flp family type IVb pilin [Thalassotalea ponticola]MDN3651735.1 Flp family type IVb pilin [Thalassotalea ponticola]